MRNRDHIPDQFSRLEAMISAAGDYVHPTDDLRARTLEAAHEQSSIKRGRRRVLTLTLAVCLATIVSLPHGPLRSRAESQQPAAADAGDLYQQAMRRSFGGHVDFGWALCEVFAELRRAQALRLGSKSAGEWTTNGVQEQGPVSFR